ncbi:MAG: hypothetical protein II738_07355 [Clostridia bacterium]|nr:hypothetical protein [Clostridia bacterium]
MTALLLLLLLTACGSPAPRVPDVDFQKTSQIQIVQENFACTAEFSFFSDRLKLTVLQPASVAGLSVVLTPDACRLSLNGAVRDVPPLALPPDGVPRTLFAVLSAFSPQACAYDPETGRFFFTTQINGVFCTLTFPDAAGVWRLDCHAKKTSA